jgi:UDP-N-acetyl-D-galactosamine dehydrogenase
VTATPQADGAGRVAVVGLGYVGLPLAALLAKHRSIVGFDLSEQRIQELRGGVDRNRETAAADLRRPGLQLTCDPLALAACDTFLVAVPTPVDKAKRPNLSFLLGASRTVGEALRRRHAERPTAPPAIVVFESTVYPGCTEEVCAPALETASGLAARTGFRLGYSPERINPGDREHTLENVVKIVAGQDADTLETIAGLYGQVVKAGVYRAPDIRTAEAAKVIENTQRDLNIALMNELSMLFHRLGLDTLEVLKAAGTKWNFLPFRPGLVGGHCIPEDPYYLTHKAEEVSFHPQVILAGRRINDEMGRYVAQETVKQLIRAGRPVKGSRVLVLGVTFKENVPDVRNTRVVDLVRELESYGCVVECFDPVAGEEAVRRLGMHWAAGPDPLWEEAWDALVLAVPHREFLAKRPLAGIARLHSGSTIVVDVKGALAMDGPGVEWRL